MTCVNILLGPFYHFYDVNVPLLFAIFKAVRNKWCTALYTPLRGSPKSPEWLRSHKYYHIDHAVGANVAGGPISFVSWRNRLPRGVRQTLERECWEACGRGGSAKSAFIFPIHSYLFVLFTGGVGRAMVELWRCGKGYPIAGGCYAHGASECGLESSAF
jgi:hypothetical protein